MIKFKENRRTLYGIALLIPAIVYFNLFLIKKFFKIRNKSQLIIANIFIFIIFQLEFLLIIFLIGRIDLSSLKQMGIIFIASSLFFLLGWDNLPYWSEED
ncbi:hypothetical protein LVJ83_07080 [Uruburuella testudinis]|uniref:Uncharacterized protein n=1 Tax=Uruburuella testudinis TaxID=1282863 RepID=A0ABY4DP43_9NEIS|nr:hypothetical protein [Uruburuella testudinis]UOO80753.1 hypothetical protein LVJ83_07080 [Uruburuella testudinis]